MTSLVRQRRRQRGLVVFALLAAAAASSAALAQAALSRTAADTFERKLLLVLEHAEQPRAGARQTFVSESEVNSYLRYNAAEYIPAGVSEPVVTILPDGRLRGRAVVDLDAVRRARAQRGSNGMLDPMNLLGGKLPVTAHGVLRSGSGRGRFEFETAEVAGVPVPKWVLQEVVSYYSRTPEQPAGLNLDEPFELPARIQEIRLRPGEAVVVQQ
jgi:hypothetical protein